MTGRNIEEALQWAFGEELGKGGGEEGLAGPGSAWSKIEGLRQYGCLIDTSGGHMRFYENTPVASEALAIGEAVKGLYLDDWFIDPDDVKENMLADWPLQQRLLAADAVESRIAGWNANHPRRRAAHVIALVITMAALRKRPDWAGDVPKVRMVMRRGHPAWFVKANRKSELGRDIVVEIDGMDRRKHRPLPGAYRKYELSASPGHLIASRMDWLLWRFALARLVVSLLEYPLPQPVELFPWAPAKAA